MNAQDYKNLFNFRKILKIRRQNCKFAKFWKIEQQLIIEIEDGYEAPW